MYLLISGKCAWIWNNQKGNSVTVYQILINLKVICTSPETFQNFPSDSCYISVQWKI